MINCSGTNRRDFIKTSILGGLAAMTAAPVRSLAQAASASGSTLPSSRVAVMAGNERADIIFKGLKAFETEIARAIGNRRVVIKPNNVSISVPLCATHADCLEATLEFLKSIGKLDNVVIAESAADGPTLDGFDNYHYTRLASKYPVKFIDLDQDEVELIHVFDEKDFRPHPVRMSRLLLDPNTFIISAAKMKTHDRVVATLSLKNIIVGAPIKDQGFRWGRNGKAGAKTDKPLIHGSGIRGINYNLFAVAQRLHPHLSIIDGFEGMQGNGPVGGTPVDHKVAVVGLDWLAADRIAVELMGIDSAKVGWLNYCAQAGMGQGDLSKIEIIGAQITDHIKPYKLSDNIEQQLVWMKPAQPA
jgi:uncharacterized protein (DUF362 family)